MILLSIALASGAAAYYGDDAGLAERARRVHESATLFDGHNDLPWKLRELGDVSFTTVDLAKDLKGKTHTDIARLRAGGVKAQFWSVYIPTNHPEPIKTQLQQIDLVRRMVARYPETFELALTAADVERIVKSGKIASLIGMEGGIVIGNDLSVLRSYYDLGARYLTLCHNSTLDWVDSATDAPKHGGLAPRGEQIAREMNRLGMLVDISHVSADTMRDVLRVSKAPVIASHSGSFEVSKHPRNVPDDVAALVKENGGVIMVVLFPGFLVPGHAEAAAAMRKELQAKKLSPEEYEAAVDKWYDEHPTPRGTIGVAADHIDHLVKVAGIDHVGIGSDFDGISTTLEGMDDVSSFPKLTEELLRRGYSDDDVRKILGGNVLRAFAEAEKVAAKLRAESAPEVDPPAKHRDKH